MMFQTLPVKLQRNFHPGMAGLSNSDDAPVHKEGGDKADL
jgi:hypothetical protein